MNCELAVKLYATMVRIRRFEEKLYELFLTRPMPGSMHQYNGQEAIAAGVCADLNRDDFVTSTHRGHGHCIAKGADLNAVMAEMTRQGDGLLPGNGRLDAHRRFRRRHARRQRHRGRRHSHRRGRRLDLPVPGGRLPACQP